VDLGTHRLTPVFLPYNSSELAKTRSSEDSLLSPSLYGLHGTTSRSTEIDFVDNQLSPNLFSLSLLPTSRERLLQQPPLRPSLGGLSQLRPAHGKLVWFRVYFQSYLLFFTLSDSVSLRLQVFPLSLRLRNNLVGHYTKGNLLLSKL